MAESTEAACLLQSGAMYPSRVGLRTDSGEDVLIGIKPGGFSVYLDDAPIYHFDFEGRWQRAFVRGVHYLKGLDGTARSVDRGREGAGLVLRRKVLGPAETVDLDASIRSMALRLMEEIRSGRTEVREPPAKARPIGPAEGRELLGRVATWDAPAWAAHRRRYEASYRGSWPFLPPDSPNPVVLQATFGPSFGSTGPAETGPRSLGEFRDHVRGVATLLGRRAGQCRDVFVAGGDWLRGPFGDLLDQLGAIDEAFPADSGPGRTDVVHALLDDFRPPLPDLDGWRKLAKARLGRVTLGIESGDPIHRATFGKSWDEGTVRSAVVGLKRAGIGVGVVALVGLGGDHVQATAKLLGSIGLDAGDLVSLVDLGSLDEAAGPTSANSPDQVAEIKRRLSVALDSKAPRVVAYNPAKRWA